MIIKIFKKYESIADLQMSVITKIQIFSETIFLVIAFYGNACNAYREGRNANVLITLLGTVYAIIICKLFEAIVLQYNTFDHDEGE